MGPRNKGFGEILVDYDVESGERIQRSEETRKGLVNDSGASG